MRINCIAVSDLTDQHLRAEWVEMLMLEPYITRSINSKNGLILSDTTSYVLGSGHARFFYDKLIYVKNRYVSIENELKLRGVKANPTLQLNDLPQILYNDWVPTKNDMILNLNRIIARISLKPTWYKMNKKNVLDWVEFYQEKYDFNYTYHHSHQGNR